MSESKTTGQVDMECARCGNYLPIINGKYHSNRPCPAYKGDCIPKTTRQVAPDNFPTPEKLEAHFAWANKVDEIIREKDKLLSMCEEQLRNCREKFKGISCLSIQAFNDEKSAMEAMNSALWWEGKYSAAQKLSFDMAMSLEETLAALRAHGVGK